MKINLYVSNVLITRLHEEKDKSLDQVLIELKLHEVGQEEKDSVKQLIAESQIMLDKYRDKNKHGIELDTDSQRN